MLRVVLDASRASITINPYGGLLLCGATHLPREEQKLKVTPATRRPVQCHETYNHEPVFLPNSFQPLNLPLLRAYLIRGDRSALHILGSQLTVVEDKTHALMDDETP